MAWLEQRGKRFRINFWYDRRHFSKTLKTADQREAEASVARLEENLRLLERGRLSLPEGGDLAAFLLSDGKLTGQPTVPRSVTLQELFEQHEKLLPAGAIEASSLATAKLHMKHLLRLLGKRRKAQDVSLLVLQEYVEKRCSEKSHIGPFISPATVKKEIATFSSVWNWAVRFGLLTGSFPRRGLKFPKAAEKPPFQTRPEIERHIAGGHLTDAQIAELWDCLYLTLPEIGELLEVVKVQAAQPFIYPMFVFAAHTGARRSEIIRARITDVDFAASVVTIRERKKSHDKLTTRRVPMTPLLAQVLSDWLRQHPGGSFLFCQPPGVTRSKTARRTATPITRDEAHDHFKRTLKESKWDVLRGWHVFRHSFISLLASNSVDQRLIDSFVGHSTEEMRRRYRHLYPSVQRSAIAADFDRQQPVVPNAV